MGLEDQGRIKQIVEREGPAETVVLLGSGDPEAAELYAETVSNGDPTFAGPLTGVSLRLPTYFITEESVKMQIPETVYQEHVAMMELVMPSDEIVARVARIREDAQSE